jgi:hypothetical protein
MARKIGGEGSVVRPEPRSGVPAQFQPGGGGETTKG